MNKYTFLAFDLGATSGRAVVATLQGSQFDMQEIYRFPNAIMELHGKFYWNIYSLYEALKESLVICARKGIHLDSIGIDTWGVDFGCVAKDGTLLGLPRAYRDPYTEGAPEEFFTIIPHEEVYRKTGIQIMNFNSLYQLFRQHKEGFEPLASADCLLFIPDLLSYLLTGNKICEYTDASTSQLLNPSTKCFESSLLEAAGVNPDILLPIVMPGTRIGELTDALAEETGIGKVPVIAVAGHDTASAVASVPAENEEFAYLSSGTWSLMGIETEEPIITDDSLKYNFTNEGGIEGTTRFLKNITGMWLLEQCRKEWKKLGREYDYKTIERMAEEETPFRSFIFPDDPRFANPVSMTEEIAAYCRETNQPVPEKDSEFIRCIYESLVMRYRDVLTLLQELAPFPIKCLHVIGGGSLNNMMSQLTANSIHLPVITGPAEATAIGNCMVQARAAGLVADRWEMRHLIRTFLTPDTYLPKDAEVWDRAYEKYKLITQ